MRIIIESTDEIGTIDGVVCRKWTGTTEAGVPCFVFVPRIAVAREHEDAFYREASVLKSTGVGDTPDGPERQDRIVFDPRLFS